MADFMTGTHRNLVDWFEPPSKSFIPRNSSRKDAKTRDEFFALLRLCEKSLNPYSTRYMFEDWPEDH